MKYRYLYFVAAILFGAVAVVEFIHEKNMTAGAVNAVTGAIFLFLGISPQGRRRG